MSLAYALTWFCDAMLYYGVLGCLGLLKWCRENLFLVPALLLAGCWLCGRLMKRPGRAKWLPLAAVVPAFILAGNAAGRIASLPMLVYMPLYVMNNRRPPDYDYAADRFRHSLIVAGAALLLAAIVRAAAWQQGLPWLFAYFTLNMALLRLLRHDDAVARSRRFRLINLGGVALVCAAGFGLSQPGIVAAVKAGWQWFLEHVVLNLAALALYAIQWMLYAVAWLLSKLPGLQEMGMPQLPQLVDRAADQAPLATQARQVQALPLAARLLIQGAGIALAAVLVFAILRALSRRMARAEAPAGSDVRESLDADAPARPRLPRLRRAPEDGVRRQYRRALGQIRARGGRVSPTMNTLQILQQNADAADADALAELREIYLPVRYGGKPAAREDLARARDAAKRV